MVENLFIGSQTSCSHWHRDLIIAQLLLGFPRINLGSLIVCFVYNLPKAALTKCQILMYAADSQVIADTLKNELLLVNKWLIDNNFFMHEGKTECMLFVTGPKLAHCTSFSIVIDWKTLNRVSEYKYLGIVLDASLTWNTHVDYLIVKVRKRLSMLGRIGKNINMYTAGTVYTSSFSLFLITVILSGAAAGVLTLISWRSCRGAKHVSLCIWRAAKKR